MMTKAKADFIFLGIISVLMQITVFQCVYLGYVPNLNTFLGCVGWLVVLIIRLNNKRFARQSVGWLLILGTFGVINFVIGSPMFSFGVNLSSVQIDTQGLNPLILLITIAWYMTNKDVIKKLWSDKFYGTAEEKQAQQQKMVDFYLQKFGDCRPDELAQIYKKINDYPYEARLAIKQIHLQQNPTVQ